MTNDVLEVEQLAVRFGIHLVFRNVSFAVPRGASFALVGPNGSGKTVLFRALLGSIPYEGRVRWARGVRIGYVPQHLDIARDVPITGTDFLRARASLARAPHEAIDRAVALVGLPHEAADLPIGALSGGQFQRLLIAFALVANPTVLLLDEPTTGVDEPGEERLNEMVHRLQVEQHLSVILISHDLTVVSRYADIVLCLHRDGVWIGAPSEMLTADHLQELYGSPVTFHVHDA